MCLGKALFIITIIIIFIVIIIVVIIGRVYMKSPFALV
jgi:hypothetical protein